MLSASTNFKNYIQENGREIALRVSWDTTVLQSEDIKSCVKWFDGELYKSVMQGLELEVEGVYDMKGKSLLVEFGVSLDGSAIEWLTWGTFLVKNFVNIAESKSTKIEAFDAMLKSHIPYAISLEYPITVGAYLQAICDHLDISLVSSTFTNSTVSIDTDKFTSMNNILFRDVLDSIAQVAGAILHIQADGAMNVKVPLATSESLNSNLKSLDVKDLFGEVNTLVLATTPAEDNTLRDDPASVASYGRHQVRIENNPLMVLTPDLYIDNLFDAIKGTKYYPFKLESYGYGYFEVGDIINVVDENSVSYSTIVLGSEIKLDGGFTEMMYAELPGSATTTDYDNAHRTLSPREIAIILNRQERKIQLIADDIDIFGQNISLIAQDLANVEAGSSEIAARVDGVTITVTSQTNKINDLQTAVDENGNAIQANADAIAEQKTHYDFGTDGLTIGKSDSPGQIRLEYDTENKPQVVISDGFNDTTVIKSNSMATKNIIIEESAILGNHKVQKLSGSTSVTIFLPV